MYSSFQAFRLNFDALARVGYFKIVSRPITQLKQSLHDAYRTVVWVVVIVYNLQHVIQVIRVRPMIIVTIPGQPFIRINMFANSDHFFSWVPQNEAIRDLKYIYLHYN